MSCPGVRNLDSGPEHRFRQRRIGSRPLRDGRSTFLPKTRIQPPAAPRTPGTAAPRPGTAAPTPGTASPNPGTAPNTTGSTPQSPNDTPAPNTTSPRSETPGATTQPPEQPVPKQSVTGARPHPLRIIGIQDAKFSAGSSVVLSEQFGTPAQAAE